MKRLFIMGVFALLFAGCKKEDNTSTFDIKIITTGSKGIISGGVYLGEFGIKSWNINAKDTVIKETIRLPYTDGFNLYFEGNGAQFFNELQVETWTYRNNVLRHLTFNFTKKGDKFILSERVDY
jgi:hypothetical protein